MSLRNLYKCKQAVYCVFCLCSSLHCCCCCLFSCLSCICYTSLCCCLFMALSPYFFILTLLLHFCLFINHVNTPIIFVFAACSFFFKNTIFIFVTITIVQQIFITELFKPQLFSSYAKCLHTILTEFFLNRICLLCIAFYIEW